MLPAWQDADPEGLWLYFDMKKVQISEKNSVQYC
jgi:hypothetical protein